MARGRKNRRGPRNAPAANSEPLRTDAITGDDMYNERFERYYKAQGILSDEEWENFLRALRAPLPTTFRLTGSRQTAQALNELITTNYAANLQDVVFEGEAIQPPMQIPWYPDGLAWQFNVSKKVLRRSPEFKKFHSFLVYETEVGNISRQEAVSMLPPLLLDVEPHHTVVDMCAAPGSKTAQLLEALHANDSLSASSLPSGLLVANDSDNKRAHLLIHQSARLPSPALLVTNLDASIYPTIGLPPGYTRPRAAKPNSGAPVARKGANTRPKRNVLLFDRILCDVPCSGDGTIRKNAGIWKTWGPGDPNGLHSLQLRILQRAMTMLSPSGRIVYSTCSLNPVENEAVIAAALQSNPEFMLVDVSSRLPGLVRRPGMTEWKVPADKECTQMYDTWEKFLEEVEEGKRGKLAQTHWSPGKAVTEELGLSKCLRIYPHLQDTGGFFVAVLERKPKVAAPATSSEVSDPTTLSTVGKRRVEETLPEDVSVEPDAKKARVEDVTTEEMDTAEATDEDEEEEGTTETPALENADTDMALPAQTEARPVIPANQRNKRGKQRFDDGSYKENPYTFLAPDDPDIKLCVEQLHLDPTFPTSSILVRNPPTEPVRSLYLANDLARAVVTHNPPARLRLLTCGTKLFSKQGSAYALSSSTAANSSSTMRSGSEGQQFRILAEGLRIALPFVNPAHVIGTGNLAALKVLLSSYYPLCERFQEPFRGDIESRSTGSYIAKFPQEEWEGAVIPHELQLPLWKSNVSVSLMVDKQAKSALSMRLFGEDITVVAQAAAKARAMNSAKNEKSQEVADGQASTDAPAVPVTPTEVQENEEDGSETLD